MKNRVLVMILSFALSVAGSKATLAYDGINSADDMHHQTCYAGDQEVAPRVDLPYDTTG